METVIKNMTDAQLLKSMDYFENSDNELLPEYYEICLLLQREYELRAEIWIND